ncbi:aldehyde dehydrogenase family protein [Paenibacillus hodogayensis]|uniref:Aldehyde dehydrogenase family protein n=1 Tax=Paenibacillus hodogayensis TaxID=279208 RepID=A0ABV5W094_9BACL
MKLGMYIKGRWIMSVTGRTRDIVNPSNGQVMGQATEGDREEAQAAIAAAREAFDSGIWSDMDKTERAAYLTAIADRMEARTAELARLEAANHGKTLREAVYDVEGAVSCFRYYAKLIVEQQPLALKPTEDVDLLIVREPVGVCGLIAAWNYPILFAAWKMAPALAAGNTLIFKPSQNTPVTAVKVFEIMDEAGLPAGVANLVLGRGSSIGDELASSHDVDCLSFTGGTQTGRTVMKAATGNMKKIALELGGKSPVVIFADADFDTALDYALYGIYMGAGQVCSAGSRILVEAEIYDRFVASFAERANRIRVGRSDDPEAEMGAISTQSHMEEILSYVQIGRDEGARLVCGGYRKVDDGCEHGYFIAPTAFADVTSAMRIVQEEIFGPVAVIQKFTREDEAVQLANDTIYGLAGAVFTRDMDKAKRVIRKIRAGITYVNTYHLSYDEGPWGGYKQSGIGRELSTLGLEEYQEVKQININRKVEPIGWFRE